MPHGFSLLTQRSCVTISCGEISADDGNRTRIRAVKIEEGAVTMVRALEIDFEATKLAQLGQYWRGAGLNQ